MPPRIVVLQWHLSRVANWGSGSVGTSEVIMWVEQQQAGLRADSAQSGSPCERSLPSGAIACLGSRLLRHGHWIWKVAISPDGTSILSGGADSAVRMWDAHSG